MNGMDSLDRKIEKLRISVVNRNLAQANFAAAEASVDRIARAFTWIRSFIAATPRDERQAKGDMSALDNTAEKHGRLQD
jgi:hypothetical protein